MNETHYNLFIKKLDECNSLAEIFTLCEKFYHLNETLSTVQRLTVKQGIKTAIKLINPPLK